MPVCTSVRVYVCVSACLPCVPCLPLTFLQSSHPQSTHLISPMAYGMEFFLVFFFFCSSPFYFFYMFVTCLVYIMSNLWVFFMIPVPVQEGKEQEVEVGKLFAHFLQPPSPHCA